MKKALIITAGVLMLVGCKPSEDKAIELAKNEIASDMKDPESSKFRDLHFVRAGEKQDGTVDGYVCGEINSKNSYGAYAGYTPFYIFLSMKSKGIFSSGVTYTVTRKAVFSSESEAISASFNEMCR
jgi:hypothetical protein